jgi:hypothetical protein
MGFLKRPAGATGVMIGVSASFPDSRAPSSTAMLHFCVDFGLRFEGAWTPGAQSVVHLRACLPVINSLGTKLVILLVQ